MNPTIRKSPWWWIPTLYFAEGIPYVAVMTIAVILYKRMGISNTEIALYTSWLYLPWVLKPLWSPFVDILKTKRWWIVSMQLLIGAGLAGVAFFIPAPFFLQLTLAFFWLLAFSSATHDIAADGFYMLALSQHDQSLYVGIRNTFYRIAMITGQGLLIMLAGALELHTGLEPVDITVKTTVNAPIYQNLEAKGISTNNGDFIVTPGILELRPEAINKDSALKLISFAEVQNNKNKFTEPDTSKVVSKKEENWWNKHISKPLGEFISQHLGSPTSQIKTSLSNVSGNVGLVGIRLTHPPRDGEKIILNTLHHKGDNSLQLIRGERLTFDHQNWNKTAFLVVQADTKLTGSSEVSFRGLSGNIPLAWSITFFILSGAFLGICLYHKIYLPKPGEDQTQPRLKSVSDISREFLLTFVSFFKKPGIGLGIFFMLTYRLAESQLLKLASPFMLDGREIGGLGLTTGEVGLVYGTVGVIALTIGGILGGIVMSKQGLKYWLWPMALAITLPNFSFVYLSYTQPESIFLINLAVAVEQFGYGFGFTAYMLYMIYLADGEHKTAHYAICTAFMALGMMLPGMAAGWLQELLGYNHFFIWVMLCTIPCFFAVSLVKIKPTFGISKKIN